MACGFWKSSALSAVFHLNEDTRHFSRWNDGLMIEMRVNFAKQRIVRERCVFTTRTPVAAGHDEFKASLVRKALATGPRQLGLSHEEFLKLGRVNGDSQESFGLTPLACAVPLNQRRQRQGEVSRELWHKMWPEALTEVPITSVTNEFIRQHGSRRFCAGCTNEGGGDWIRRYATPM